MFGLVDNLHTHKIVMKRFVRLETFGVIHLKMIESLYKYLDIGLGQANNNNKLGG